MYKRTSNKRLSFFICNVEARNMRSYFQKYRYFDLLEDEPQSIVILRALMIGDLLCAVPAFRALRAAFPRTKITLIGLPWAKQFVRRFSEYLDDFIEFPGYPGLPERDVDAERISLFFKEVQSRHFDLALQMHGSGSYVNSITFLLGAAKNAGFYLESEYCPDPIWFMPFPEKEHEIFKYLNLMEFLGINTMSPELEFPITDEDEEAFRELEEGPALLGQDYVCIHAGARLLTRRWLAYRFAEVADRLAEFGLKVILTGSKEEASLVNDVGHLMKSDHINLVGKTTLGALAVLLKHSRLLICNDTGVSHIASALQVPSVVIVTGSDPQRWAPLDQQLHKTVYSSVFCRPCSHISCPIGQLCAYEVSVEDVFEKAVRLLQETSEPSLR
jgi:ADP-heptose:LPS heptosyltransferase